MEYTEYSCPVRKLKLSIKHSIGERCYLGSKGNICNADSKLCDVLEAHELSQSQPKCTTEDHGPLGKPSYEKKDDPSLRSPVQKRY